MLRGIGKYQKSRRKRRASVHLRVPFLQSDQHQLQRPHQTYAKETPGKDVLQVRLHLLPAFVFPQRRREKSARRKAPREKPRRAKGCQVRLLRQSVRRPQEFMVAREVRSSANRRPVQQSNVWHLLEMRSGP
jgi:hypothetical protein